MLLVVATDGTRQWGLAVTDAAGFAGAVLLVGLYVGTRRAYLAELRDRARRLERERDASSALAAAEERARIAREMHDGVAHHLTVIVALSDGALRAVTRSPAEACDAIRDGYECTGIAAELPTGVQLAVFRLVQEALRNTMKHAGPRASAAVRLQVSSGEVSVDIEDDGAGGMTQVGAAGGGLTGMRERIRAFGGELDCGPRDPRGWRVSARIRPGAAAVS